MRNISNKVAMKPRSAALAKLLAQTDYPFLSVRFHDAGGATSAAMETNIAGMSSPVAFSGTTTGSLFAKRGEVRVTAVNDAYIRLSGDAIASALDISQNKRICFGVTWAKHTLGGNANFEHIWSVGYSGTGGYGRASGSNSQYAVFRAKPAGGSEATVTGVGGPLQTIGSDYAYLDVIDNRDAGSLIETYVNGSVYGANNLVTPLASHTGSESLTLLTKSVASPSANNYLAGSASCVASVHDFWFMVLPNGADAAAIAVEQYAIKCEPPVIALSRYV